MTLTPEEIAAAQAREAAGAAQAEAIRQAYLNNTAPRLPYYGNQVGYTQEEIADAAREAAKHDAAFHTTYDYESMAGLTLSQIASRYGTAAADNVQEYYRANPSARAQAIDAEYAAQQNRVIGSEGVMYQGESRQTQNPYNPDSALGVAWEVGRTGGATDFQMNLIAEQEAKAAGVDVSFIRYATDVYMERPGFEREVLTTREGQQFTNEAWHGVPIRLNLTRGEMAAGGGIDKDNFGKFLGYDDTTHLLTRFDSPEGTFGIDSGVHKERGDFGGPILKDGTYGGWGYQGDRTRGIAVVAGDLNREPIRSSESIAKKPFTSASLGTTRIENPSGEIFGFYIPGISEGVAFFEPKNKIATTKKETAMEPSTEFGEPYTVGDTTYYPSTTKSGNINETTETATPLPGTSGFDEFNEYRVPLSQRVKPVDIQFQKPSLLL